MIKVRDTKVGDKFIITETPKGCVYNPSIVAEHMGFYQDGSFMLSSIGKIVDDKFERFEDDDVESFTCYPESQNGKSECQIVKVIK